VSVKERYRYLILQKISVCGKSRNGEVGPSPGASIIPTGYPASRSVDALSDALDVTEIG